MTKEEVVSLAVYYAGLPTIDRLGLNHFRTMVPKMKEIEDKEKLMRWLGFMQGALWMAGAFELEELKQHNKFGIKVEEV